jgi:hypothetical protein
VRELAALRVRSRRWLRAVLVVAAVLFGGAAAPAASGASPIRIGVGDQSPAMFDAPAYQALKLTTTRYIFPWNGMNNPYELTKATQFVERAQSQGVSVVLHLSTDDFTPRKAKLPTVAAYTAQLRRIVRHFRPRGVTEWGVWNEANHASQPTFRDPVRAAMLFRAMYGVVGDTDRIVALDVLDQGGVERYEQRFYGALSPTFVRRARLVGLHNYGDVNRNRTTYTASMIRTARHANPFARFWFTETGGLVEFGHNFPCSTRRAADRTENVFSLATRNHAFVDRVYLYNWSGPGCGATRFDAGLTGPHGTPRAAYRTLKRRLPQFSR